MKSRANQSFVLFIVYFLVATFTVQASGFRKLDNSSIKKLSGDVNFNVYGKFAVFKSPYFAMSWYTDFPMLSYWGVESGGRSHHYAERNLLRPGLGGTFVSYNDNSFGKKSSFKIVDDGISYESVCIGNHRLKCSVHVLSSKQYKITIKSLDGYLDGQIFKVATAPDVAPVSVWSGKLNIPASTEYDEPESIYSPLIEKASLALPSVFSFPDYGNVRIEASDPNVYIQEHLLPDKSNVGLNLGQGNIGGHVRRVSIHLGSVMLSFHTLVPLKEVELLFTVMDENYPHIAGCDFSDARFDGLKRCWQNSFTLNPATMSMGDNILLDGIGHISLYFKSDLLPFTPRFSTSYSMIDAMKTSIELALLKNIDPETNRLKGFAYEGTESTLIAIYNYLLTTHDWAFVKTYQKQIIQLVHGVLRTDIDHDGILEDPFHGNYLGGKVTSSCWWDDFAFGYKNAYRNLLAYRALTSTEKIFHKLHLSSEEKEISQFLDSFRASFHKTFYNKQSGFYAGWISQDGHIHDYAFTFINATAIYLGLVPQKLSKDILTKMLKMMEKENYDFVYGVPGNIIPVDPKDRIGWEEMCRWGRYENGGLCGQTAYHFIQALYTVGMKKEADHILFTMMATFERDYTHSGLMPGYQKSIDWRTKGGEPCGYNYLADNYYFLLAALTGYYHIPYPELQDPD